MHIIYEGNACIKIKEDDYCIIVFSGCDLTTINNEDSNVDVEIVLKNGNKYSGTIFTLKNIQSLMNNYKQSGECCNGLFFAGCRDIVLVEKLNLEVIAQLIKWIYEKGDLETVFDHIIT